MRKDRFPPRKYDKLRPMVGGSFRVIKRIGENAYKLEMSDDLKGSPIFNVKDLRPYHGEDLRTSLFYQLRGIDARAIPRFEDSIGSVGE